MGTPPSTPPIKYICSLCLACLLSVFIENKVIVVGGMGVDTNPKDYIMEYDIEKDQWKALTPMPTARYATFSFFIEDKLYVIGRFQLINCIKQFHGVYTF